MNIGVPSATAALAGLLACRNAMAPAIQHRASPPDIRCSPTTIGLDSSYTGRLSASSACRTRDLRNRESTYTRFYDLSLQAGQGYLVEMQPVGPLQSLLELTSPDSTSPTLLAASRDVSGRAELLFVAPAKGTERIRATTLFGGSADTGRFVVFARTCKVPVPAITAFAITHADTSSAADCQMSLGALNIGDQNVSNVQLYQVHATSDTLLRLVTFTASAPVRIFFGGPHEDTFAQVGATMMGYLDSATVGTSFYLATGKAGDYTLVIGGDQGLPGPVRYTTTIGAEQPFPVSAVGVAVTRTGR